MNLIKPLDRSQFTKNTGKKENQAKTTSWENRIQEVEYSKELAQILQTSNSMKKRACSTFKKTEGLIQLNALHVPGLGPGLNKLAWPF